MVAEAADPEAVLRSGLGVCEGYARLLAALLEGMGIEAAYVKGVYDPPGLSPGCGHAWAAVRLADGWYLLEPTLATGHVAGDTFVRAFDEDGWLVPPGVPGRTHRPEDLRRALGAREATWPGRLGAAFEEDVCSGTDSFPTSLRFLGGLLH